MRLRLRNGTLVVALLCALYGCKKAEEAAPAATPSESTTQESVTPSDTAPAADAAATTDATTTDATATTDAAAAPAAKGNADNGKQLYAQFCTTCHGTDGKGDGPAGSALDPKPTNHTDAAYMNTLTDEHLYKVISEGGAAVGKSPTMMGWIGSVGEQGVHDLVAYLRVLSGGAQAAKQ